MWHARHGSKRPFLKETRQEPEERHSVLFLSHMYVHPDEHASSHTYTQTCQCLRGSGQEHCTSSMGMTTGGSRDLASPSARLKSLTQHLQRSIKPCPNECSGLFLTKILRWAEAELTQMKTLVFIGSAPDLSMGVHALPWYYILVH